jgi:HAMP domain-containing protein
VEGASRRDRPYVREGHAKPYVQPVFHERPGGPAITFSAPVMSAGDKTLAILVGRTDLVFLDGLMAERAGLGSTGRSFLVDHANAIVTAAERGKDAPGPALSPGITRALDGESGTAVYTSHDGRGVVGAHRPIAQIGLALVAEMDAHEAFAPIQRFRLAILALFVIVSIAAALVGVRLARGISRPIEELAKAAGAIGDGDLDHRVDAVGPREVTALARAFNGMAEDIARSRGDLMAHSSALEGKVTDRTRNLTALLEVTQALGSTLDLTESLWCAARSLVRILRADAGVAYVLDEGGVSLKPVAGYHLPPDLRGTTDRALVVVKSHALISEACDSRQAAFV